MNHFVTDCRAQIALALPIMGAQFAQVGMAVVDTIMTGHYAAAHLAAVSVGASLWLPVYLLIAGILMAVTPHVARAHGADSTHALSAYIQNALRLGLVLGCVGGLAFLLADPAFAVMGVEDEIRGLGSRYLLAVGLGFPALALYHVLRGLSEGMHLARPVLLTGILGLLVNIPANYLLIHGGLGLPALGAFGCGLATAVSMWAMMLGMAAYVLAHPRFTRLGLFHQRHAMAVAPMARILRIGLPMGLSIFFEVSLFAVIALLVAGLGTVTVAAHQIALNFASLVFMMPLGLGLALTVRVGHARGRGEPGLAARRARHGMTMSAVLGLVLALLMMLAAPYVVPLYTPDTEIQRLAASLILLAALFQLSDTLQVNAAGALRGYEDTRAIMLITLPAYWLAGLGTGIWLGLSPLPPGPFGVHGFWIGLLAGLSAAAILLMARLRWIGRAAGEVVQA